VTIRDLRRQAIRVSATIAGAGTLGLLVLLAIVGPLKDGALSSYRQGLEIAPILYAGGLLLILAFPGFILHAIRPGFSLLASGAAATVSAGTCALMLGLGNPSLADFAWAFVAGQATSLLAITLGVAVEIGRGTEAPHVLTDNLQPPLPTDPLD
jgi:hypothetical protein